MGAPSPFHAHKASLFVKYIFSHFTNGAAKHSHQGWVPSRNREKQRERERETEGYAAARKTSLKNLEIRHEARSLYWNCAAHSAALSKTPLHSSSSGMASTPSVNIHDAGLSLFLILKANSISFAFFR